MTARGGGSWVGEEFSTTAFGRQLTGKRWGNPAGAPTIALHGWLDNANTFDRLAPLLPELNLLALDFAGHGRSEHRPAGTHYLPTDDVQDVLAVADALGWQTFTLIGHSMGAEVGSLLAGLFPERVERAVMIDGYVSTGGTTPAERVDQTREALERMLQAPKSPKVFPSTDAMAQRVTEATDQSIDAARSLVQRGHKAVDGGVTWCTDARIRAPGPVRANREYFDELMRRCTVPCLLLIAEQGDDWFRSDLDDIQAHHPQLSIERMSGPHHVHLEPDYVDEVGRRVRRFLSLD